MKRILSLLLALCMMFCTALPAFALDIGADGIPTMVGVCGEDTLDSGTPTIGESGDVSGNETPIPGETEGFGTIRLTLKDVDNGSLLIGAVLEIYRVSDDVKLGELITSGDGTAISQPLPVGDYYLLELQAPSGYEASTEKYPLTVAIGETADITVLYKRILPNIGMVKIIKTDAADSNQKLSGAIFSVYETTGGKKMGELLTGEDGTATLELPENDYTIRETAAPEGYQLSTESISLHLKAGETRELTVKNSKAEPEQPEKPGTLRIVKADKDSGKKLKDAVFGVYRSDDDKLVKKITTDRKGIAELELPVGDYYIRELEAPDGYKLKKAAINFHIDADETKELTVKNVKEDSEDETGTLRIIKEDKETGDPLKNATFGIYDSDDYKINELPTGKDGTAELDLPVGIYYLRELEAPKGYQLDRKKVTFKVTEDKTIKVTVENTKEKEADKTGTLRIVKSAAGTGRRLSGAVFGVYASSGDKRLDELATDKDGVATLDLPVGSYYLKEQKAPEGFEMETARIQFNIVADGKTLVEVTNEKEGGEPTPEQAFTPTVPIISPTPTNPPTPTSPEITLPKTGEAFPTLQYALALLCLGTAALCGTVLYRQRKKPENE